MRDDKFKPIKAPVRTPKPPPPMRDRPPTAKEIDAALVVIRRVLSDMRWNDQGGYSSYDGNGKWAFVSTSIGQFTPDELNALFAFAGMTPDEIEPVGYCEDCANSDNGRERGWSRPCVSCLRPSHINHFVPIEKVTKRSKSR